VRGERSLVVPRTELFWRPGEQPAQLANRATVLRMIIIMRPDFWIMLGCCELTALLVSADDLRVAFKKPSQRTPGEHVRVVRGLGRALLLEFALFAPATSLLVWAISPALPLDFGAAGASAYAPLFGIASYGFPLRAVRTLMQRIAMSTLQEFASIANPEVLQDATRRTRSQEDGEGAMKSTKGSTARRPSKVTANEERSPARPAAHEDHDD
jgi:hypothetical protein